MPPPLRSRPGKARRLTLLFFLIFLPLPWLRQPRNRGGGQRVTSPAQLFYVAVQHSACIPAGGDYLSLCRDNPPAPDTFRRLSSPLRRRERSAPWIAGPSRRRIPPPAALSFCAAARARQAKRLRFAARTRAIRRKDPAECRVGGDETAPFRKFQQKLLASEADPLLIPTPDGLGSRPEFP